MHKLGAVCIDLHLPSHLAKRRKHSRWLLVLLYNGLSTPLIASFKGPQTGDTCPLSERRGAHTATQQVPCRTRGERRQRTLIEKNIGPSSASHSGSTAVTLFMYSLWVYTSSWYTI